jgi:ATP-dependent DNA ligase
MMVERRRQRSGSLRPVDLEGIVSKRIGSRYVSGRTRAWLKTKNPDFEREQKQQN